MDIFRLKSKKKQQAAAAAAATSTNASTKSTSTSATDQLDQIAISTAEMETDATYALDVSISGSIDSNKHSNQQHPFTSVSPKSTTKASHDTNTSAETSEPVKRSSIKSGIDALLDSDDDEYTNADIFNDGDNSSGEDDNITTSSEQQQHNNNNTNNFGTPNSRRSTLSIKSKTSHGPSNVNIPPPPMSTPTSNIMAISPLSATSTASSSKKLFHHDILDALSTAMQDVTTAATMTTVLSSPNNNNDSNNSSSRKQQSALGMTDQEDDDDDDDDKESSYQRSNNEDDDDDNDEIDNTGENDDNNDDDKSNNSESAEDYSDDEDEGEDGYKAGGYHPVKVGEVYNQRYEDPFGELLMFGLRIGAIHDSLLTYAFCGFSSLWSMLPMLSIPGIQ